MTRAGVKLAKLGEAIKITREELFKTTQKNVGEKELRKTKEMIKGGLILSLEDSHEVANRYAHQLILDGKIMPPSEALAKIEAVTAEEVRTVARDLFRSEKLNLAVIGPYEESALWEAIRN
jgi:predicted Zn-dependent peptidase